MIRSPEKYETCLTSKSFNKKDCEYFYLSDEFIKDNKSRLNYVQKNLNDLKNELDEKIKTQTKNSFEGTHAVLIKFRPIFQDLNKQKTGLNYDEIICINPSLKVNTIINWSSKYSKNYFDTNSILAVDIMKAKVCKKYAKFE